MDAEAAKPVVLVVEDEPLLLLQAMSLVEDAGMCPVAATSADAAIEILVARTDIRIVFTDVHMPGSMDGVRLAEAIRGRWPPIEIIVTCDMLKLSAEDLPSRGHFLAKPYDPKHLIETLQRFAV